MKEITVRYYDTFRRESFSLTAEEEISSEELVALLDSEVTKRGLSICDTRQVYLLGLMEASFEEGKPLSGDQPLTVVYTNIVCPNNAQEFDRENGIRYYFHPGEKNHLMNPHIHAEADGSEEMSFSLSGTWIAGSFKSPAKMKEAKKYVKRNHDIIKAAWDATREKGYPLTRKEIEKDKDKWMN